ncbi:polysaccharide deacetylase family protein [Christiangramia salexigens]|nr:polysaccharide deacetylase family protein [Christiangramia salexigens]
MAEQAVGLSFDDGPVENTLRILEVLDRHAVKAAFFCIGENIKTNPEIFKEIIKRGHIVGNHTYSHSKFLGIFSRDGWLSEIKRCDEIAKDIAGVKMELFRPPFGILNPKTKRALKITGHKVIGWSIRPYDAITGSEDLILKRITKNIEKGDLILLHDNMDKTVAILEQLLVILKEQNFGVVRPDELFDINAYT